MLTDLTWLPNEVYEYAVFVGNSFRIIERGGECIKLPNFTIPASSITLLKLCRLLSYVSYLAEYK